MADKNIEKIDKIAELLSRGVEEVIDAKNLEAKLRSGKKLRVKLGIDPTSPNIHIGRAITLWKLRAFQELGHKIVFIIGDFTAMIGDTSDKEAERQALSAKQIKENMKTYKQQVGKILDLSKTEIHHNSKWLNKLRTPEVFSQAEQFSLHEFAARENIAKRLNSGKRVNLKELFYPLMQGYDSVAIKADVEVGGTDQRYNLLAGRTLQKFYGQQPQDIMTFSLLEGTDGRKMSSSWGNVINIVDEANEMYGKVMSILDELIIKYFVLCTRVPIDEIKQIEKEMGSGKLNPRDAKARLAFELVKIYHGEKAAQAAAEHFDSVHKNKEIPDEMPELNLAGETILKVLTESKIAKSANEAKRLIDQGGVKIDGQVAKKYDLRVDSGAVVQSGKRNFLRVK